MTVKEMLNRMDSVELTYHMAYDQMKDEDWLKEFERKLVFEEYMKENDVDG